MANKRCPTCGVRYTGPEKFCTKCGGGCRQRMRTDALKTRKTSERMRKRDEESGIYRPWHQ